MKSSFTFWFLEQVTVLNFYQLDQAVSDLNFSNMRCLRLEASALNGYLERWSFRSTEGIEDELPDLSCELEQVLGPSGDVCMEELSADDLIHVLGSPQDVCMPGELSHLSPLDIEQVLGIPEQGGLDNAPTVDDLTLSRILEAEFHFSSLEEKFDSFEADIIDILQQALQRHKTIRFFLQTEVELIKTNDASGRRAHFVSKCQRVFTPSMLNRLVKESLSQIYNRLLTYNKEGSSFIFSNLLEINLNIGRYTPMYAGCQGVKPPAFIANRRALLNINAPDDMCFYYSILAALYPVSSNPDRSKHYEPFLSNLKGVIPAPMPRERIKHFEELNSLAINVYSVEEKEIFPLQLSENVDSKEINLFIYKSHYFLIRHFNRLFDSKSLYVCHYCLYSFKSKELVMEHEKTCRVHGAQRVKYPKEGSKLSFSKFSNNFKQIFAIYADFEAILQPNPDPSKYSVHVPCSYCYIVVDPESNIVHKEIYRGENPAEKFLLSLFSTVSKLKERLRNYPSVDMNEQQKIDFLNEQTCHIWAAHKICNLNYHNNSKFRCLLHGAKNYDNHFLIKALRHVPHKHVTIIPMNIEKYSVILVLSQCFPYQTDLLRCKGVYPYEYMTDSSKFSETSLPPIEYCSSKLLNESCSNESYAFAQQVWEELNCTTLGDYHDIYLIGDVALLAYIFQYFRDLCLRHYQLDPILNLSSPSLSLLTQH
ncbi:hypothetical protein LAZ67_9001201 [Cordylochernes scorpioides]|uniref:C2H2-type domain-containing protein n=1 Tax=Cordylochernes scorpioides TaxID=51811 RepID=A0ABY6KTJ6_9ARAC|nr:hypothetical protein LAZ67_9001201 [Cordylochernes scorpioides]